MYCPKCGHEMIDVEGKLTCIEGNMTLSTVCQNRLLELFPEQNTRPYQVELGVEFMRRFCPSCGVPVKDYSCTECGKSILPLRYMLVEYHLHKGEIDAFKKWKEQQKKIKLNVTFKSTLAVDMSAHPIGEELAKHLANQFTQAGITIEKIDNYEDFGWSLDTTVRNKKLFLLLGYIGDGDYEWLLQINKYKSSFWDLFRKNAALQEQRNLALKVHETLASDSHINTIKWHKGYYAKGKHSDRPDR